jgi:N-acylglucosamine 2-epimerase
MDRQRMEQLLAVYREGLLNSTLPFWMKNTIDHEYGGFLNYLDHDGTVVSTDKPVWVLGRFTWLTALLYNAVEPRDEWLATSRHGIEFIEKYCFDTDGRMFYEVTRDGQPLRKRRYIFAETFGCIAFSEYARATGDEARLRRARDLYELIVRYYQNPGLLPPKVFPQTRRTKSHAMPMIILATTQQIRKHGDDPLYDAMTEHCIQEICTQFLHEEKRALLENVGPNGEFMDTPEGRTVNPGHAIESAWFLMHEARRQNRPALLDTALKILDWSLEWGWDEEYGGLLYFVDVHGMPCLQYEHDMKLWWPHNEAIYATLLAHHLTGDDKYAAWHERLHHWAYAHFPDMEYGDWFKYLHRDGSVSETIKGNAWAGPFHLPRMQLYCWKLLEEMLKKDATTTRQPPSL